MLTYVALLRAVNVGGTGKLSMDHLKLLCAEAGLAVVRTYIASGNVVFQSGDTEDQVRARLEAQLADYAGKPVGVIVRTAAEIAGVAARNPFADEPDSRVMALFTDADLPDDPLHGAAGVRDEQVRRGRRELYILYPNGQADTRLRLPTMTNGTARNLNTVRKLAEMAAP